MAKRWYVVYCGDYSNTLYPSIDFARRIACEYCGYDYHAKIFKSNGINITGDAGEIYYKRNNWVYEDEATGKVTPVNPKTGKLIHRRN